MAGKSRWGSSQDRYVKETRVRRLLALDGGGIRGVMTLVVLREIERQLRVAWDDPTLCLGDAFDYVGGTSTGAIIASGIAIGMTVDEILAFYEASASLMFEKSALLDRLKRFYSSEPLKTKLKQTFGADTTLGSEKLRSLLLVVTRNASTDSAWPVSSNPNARYNDQSRQDCNLQIPLWQLVRASTAAPVFFPPEILRWDPQNEEKTFLFQDGGMTPYNNPAFLLFRMATLPQYRLGWPMGEQRMMLVSVGTGSAPAIDGSIHSPDPYLLSTVPHLPGALMSGAKVDQDINCRIVGRCVAGAHLDREIEDLITLDDLGQSIPLATDLGRAFLYARYDADLSAKGLAKLGLSAIDVDRIQKMDAVDAVDDLKAVGRAVAATVDLNRFGSLINK
jgi:hypothetical protein